MTRATGCIRLAAVLAAAAPFAALAQMAVPAVGARYTFDCTSAGGASRQERYTVTANDDGVIRVENEIGQRKNWYEKPYYLSGTSLFLSENVGGRISKMRGVAGQFKGLAGLKVGDKFTGYVTESRPGDKLNWNYTITVVGREVAYNRELGDLKVVALNEERWVNLYQSTLLSHYAPRLAFPVYWLYRDINGAREECTLASAEGYGAAQVATAPAQRPAPPPKPVFVPPPKPVVAPPPKPVAAPAPKPAAAAPPAPTKQPAGQPMPAPKPATTSADNVPLSTAQRLAYLTELRNLGLITQDELVAKQAEISGERSESAIADEFNRANVMFLQRKITPEQFVAMRARILAKVNPETMPGREGLTLLNQLMERKLISRIEFNRKRQEMLSAL